MATKVKFPTKYDDRGVFKSNPGSRLQSTYKMTVAYNGAHILKKLEGKEVDVYAQIQSYKESTDVNVILERFARGDVSVLSKIQGTYGNFTEMPQTLAELQQRVIDAENIFYALPLETRAQFEHNPSIFFSEFGSEKFNAALGLDKVEESVDLAKDVVENTVINPAAGGSAAAEQKGVELSE